MRRSTNIYVGVVLWAIALLAVSGHIYLNALLLALSSAVARWWFGPDDHQRTSQQLYMRFLDN